MKNWVWGQPQVAITSPIIELTAACTEVVWEMVLPPIITFTKMVS